MPRIETLFATQVYRAEIGGRTLQLNADVRAACLSVAAEDRAGQAWCREHGFHGYTSYASLDDLTWRQPAFEALAQIIDSHVSMFAAAIDLDLGRQRLMLDSIWINILEPGGYHTAHIHPHAVVSGTYYVEIPKGASAIRFEDPRHGLMMAAPPRKSGARRANRTFVAIAPKAGTLLLWESWLRHEVPQHRARTSRVSVSFNYAWGQSGAPARGRP